MGGISSIFALLISFNRPEPDGLQGCSPIEAKGKKGGNIPIQANPGNSVATFA
jgi:hypothetical protein